MEKLLLSLIPSLLTMLSSLVDRKRKKQDLPPLSPRIQGIMNAMSVEGDLHLSAVIKLDRDIRLEVTRDDDTIEPFIIIFSTSSKITIYEND